MKKRFCDKCGAELPLGTKGNVKIGLWIHSVYGEGLQNDNYKVFHYDLCNDCAGKLTEFISGTNEAETFQI